MSRWVPLGVLALFLAAPVLAADRAEVASQAKSREQVAPAAGEPRRKVRVVLDGKVNVNTASVQMLDLLPGVGLKAAERIVAQRQKRPFRRPEELAKVKGFGRKKFQRIRPYVSVQGPTTLHPVWVGLGKEVEPSEGG